MVTPGGGMVPAMSRSPVVTPRGGMATPGIVAWGRTDYLGEPFPGYDPPCARHTDKADRVRLFLFREVGKEVDFVSIVRGVAGAAERDRRVGVLIAAEASWYDVRRFQSPSRPTLPAPALRPDFLPRRGPIALLSHSTGRIRGV